MRLDLPIGRRTLLRSLAGAGGLLAAGGAVAGCGGDNGRSSSTTRTIKQWYHQYGEAGTQQAAQRYAKAYRTANVTVQWTPGDYPSKLASGLLSSSGPDVFEDQLNVDLVRGKQIVALDDVIAPVKDDFTATTLGLATVDGKVYGIPMIEDMQLLYYRKSLLARAGLQPPSSTGELLAAAKALTTKNVKGLFVGNDGGASVLGGPSLWSVGADYPQDAHWAGFGDRAASALAQLRTLFTSGSLLLGAPADWSDPSAFVNGLAAMQWTGIWALPAIQKAFGDDVGVAAWPALNATGAPSVPIGTWNAMVSTRSADIDAAKAFVKWLWIDQKDYQKDWAQGYGVHIPTRKSVAAVADRLSSGLASEVLALSNRYARAAGPPIWTPKMSTAYSDALNNVIRQGADPARELATAESTAKAELTRLYG
jgi:multiple sugar transport system substrate-binding protein